MKEIETQYDFQCKLDKMLRSGLLDGLSEAYLIVSFQTHQRMTYFTEYSERDGCYYYTGRRFYIHSKSKIKDNHVILDVQTKF